MQKTRIPSLWLFLTLWLGLAMPARAMGFGEGSPSAILGQRLDFAVDLRLDPGETLEPSCVRAKVLIGDRAVAPESVGTSLVSRTGGGQAIRVRTLQRIDEPVVSIQVEVGCSVRMVRRYVVFADPPTIAPSAMAELSAPPAAQPPLPAAAPAPAAVATVQPPPTAPAVQPPVPERPRTAPRPAPRPTSRPSPRPSPRPAPEAAPSAVNEAPAEPAPAASPPARSAASQPAPRARLRLDPAPPMTSPADPAATAPAMDLIDQANEAVKAAIAATTASQSRIAALEDNVRQLMADAAAQRESVDMLRARAALAERRGQWMMPLALAVLALLALAGWLWLRLRELERERQRSWLAAAQSASRSPPSAPPIPPTPSRVPLLVERSVRSTGVAALGAGLAPVHEATPSELPEGPSTATQEWYSPEAAMQQTRPLVPQAANPAYADAEARAVSAEELIDLEQQAEFFVVLGQDDAAIDLLVSHLRDTGGASPLPYLKLLEIYRRKDDEAAYERTRQRFNQRFNAHAPGWDVPVGDGRVLAEYPTVMGWIQHVWPKPLDAMAELESLLFRKDGGELFDLPAYRELLFLYALARDLLDGDSAGAGAGVDVLLPLNDSPGFASTSARPYFGDEPRPGVESQATAPIDLDLDLPVQSTAPDRRP